MKYHEAIDMILDGGAATSKNVFEKMFEPDEWQHNKNWHIRFNLTGTLLQDYLRNGITIYFPFETEIFHFKEDDWIVEKDGVVYEEYATIDKICSECHNIMPNIMGDLMCLNDMCKENSNNKNGVDEIKIPIVADEVKYPDFRCCRCSGKRIDVMLCQKCYEKEVKMPIIEDEVNEDCLEKKMLCFVGRHFAGGLRGDVYFKKSEKCKDEKCYFCFPGQSKNNHIDDAEKMVDELAEIKSNPVKCPKCNGNMYQCDEVKLSLPPQPVYRCAACDDGDFREEVTVEDIEYQLNRYCEALSDYNKALSCGDHNMHVTQKETLMRLEKGYLMREIKYLISLQGLAKCDHETRPEKVKLSVLISNVEYFRQAAYFRGKSGMDYVPDAEREEFEQLKQKLEYLVSFQELTCAKK